MDAKERIVAMTDILYLVAILMSLPPDLFSFLKMEFHLKVQTCYF